MPEQRKPAPRSRGHVADGLTTPAIPSPPLTRHGHRGIRNGSAELLRNSFPAIRESHQEVADRLVPVLVFYYVSEKQMSDRQRQAWKAFWRDIGVDLADTEPSA